ncbi:molybdate ABC transporter substrate-binding protein [Desulfatitalea alkaliphila]|uniref:Molybdate ABC transporter substrate-binding protein n=1 Tax=Desulfatitalea alkaliphila TaxID=2929485 RepID=A0AA41R2M2_9BACT|nr:molybdate ABC transporter substrate-binding protein [Desulfatitalea alkaliphila]MCJ8499805.1 molybdate ABC transporter substrate-binding protein [Desulfatitalea alkaliphila]
MKVVKRRSVLFAMMLMLTLGGVGFAVEDGIAGQGEVVVFAAASTTNAITEIGDLFAAAGLGHITTSFASSSTLAKQIAGGAPADVFLSANVKWMDFLEEKEIIDKASRFDLLGNRIVLIAPLQSAMQKVDVRQGLDLAALLGGDGRFSMGDPAHVPAGIYGKTAMEHLGLWGQVKDRLAPMKDVRAALVMVERAEAPMGLVYATDAAISKKVRIVGMFPVESHPSIIYPVAAVAGGKADAAARFLDFLKTAEARAVFENYGFEVR